MRARDDSITRRGDVRDILQRERQSIAARPGTGDGQNTDRRLTEAIEILLEEVHDLEWRIRELEDTR